MLWVAASCRFPTLGAGTRNEYSRSQLDTPILVATTVAVMRVTVRPFRPSCSDCATQDHVSDSKTNTVVERSLLHEHGHAQDQKTAK